MDENQTLRSMVRDDAYHVVRVLADGPSGRTELVTLDGEGPLVRKSIPAAIANAAAWAVAMEVDEPLLPRIEELYRMPDRLVVVYDYVEGRSASEVVQEKGPLTPVRAAEVVCDVCTAVSALHDRGVVHRDITPANVILAKDGAHLVDLGIARQQTQNRNRDTTALGTWGFAAPEQFGFAQTDARSDVFSLGRLLGYLLTGCRPDAEQYEVALDNEQLVDQSLAQVAHKATAFEPSARYQSAQELSDAVRRALRATPTQPRETPSLTSQAKPQAVSSESLPASSSETERRERRSLVDVPRYLQVMVIVYWMLLALAAALVAVATIDILITGEPHFGPAQYCMSVVAIAGMLLLGAEAYRAVTLAKPYAGCEKPLRLFLKQTGRIAGLTAGLLVAAGLVLPG